MSENKEFKLVRSVSGWAISRSGKKVTLSAWSVVKDAAVVGSIYQVLSAGGARPWTTSNGPVGERHYSRKEALAGFAVN